MDDTELQQALRDQLPTLAAPTAPPHDARTQVHQAVARRRRRVRATVAASVAGVLALVILVPLAVTGWAGSDDADDPVDRGIGQWQPIAPSPLSPRNGSTSVWTGEEMIVVGGDVGAPCPPTAECTGPRLANLRQDGAAYDPATDSWRSIARAPVPLGSPWAVWTGREMVVVDTWFAQQGGSSATLAYDPDSDSWRTLKAPPALDLIGGVWDGRELVFWASEERAGSADWSLDPSTGQWTKLPDDPFESTYDRAYVWTGDQFLFFAVNRDPAEDATFHVAEYDPASRTWQRLPDSPVLHGDPMWFFHQGYVVNPYEDPRFDPAGPTNGAYNPDTGTWSEAPHSGVYTYHGCALGPLGSAGDWLAPAGGVLYSLDPADAVVTPDCPQLPDPAAAAWTGEQVIIWGGPDQAHERNTAIGLTWSPPPAG